MVARVSTKGGVVRLRDLFAGGTPAGGARRPASWVPAGVAVSVAGREIPGGLIYAGCGMTSISGHPTEPALIDPTLPVDWRKPDLTGRTMGYWPFYDGITPQARAGYLQWLIGGRRDPTAYIGYVFLFYYGLERRVLSDLGLRAGDAEVGVIAAEVRRLAELYGHHGSFGTYARNFLDLVDSATLINDDTSPGDIEMDERTWQVPFALRVAVARLAADGKPLSGDWALAWLRNHPMAYLRTPADRCAEEFDALFRLRYVEEYGEGIQLRGTGQRIRIDYRPASGGFGGSVEATVGDLPDVTWGDANMGELRAVAASCSDALDPYSRYLGRHPDGRGTPQASGLLPESVLREYGGAPVRNLSTWLESVEDFGVVPVDELVGAWSPDLTVGKIGKTEAVALASLLAKLGYGIEPDVRFGSPRLKAGGSAVLFRLPAGSAATPSPEYTEASLLIRLSGLLAASDGRVSEEERRLLATHLESSAGMEEAERRRVEASLVWVGATGLQLTGLKRKLEALPQSQRVTLGRFLVDVAIADGEVSPEEITTLTKLYRLLGLEEANVYSAVHAIEAGDDRPVVVLEGSSERRHPIAGLRPSLDIDRERLAARRAETAEVAALLGEVFAEEDSTAVAPVVVSPVADDSRLGLDTAHIAVLAMLPSKESWSRAELEKLILGQGLPLVDAAIDRINEAAFDQCDEPVLEGEDPWELNQYALEALS